MMTLQYQNGKEIPHSTIKNAVAALISESAEARSRAYAALQLPIRRKVENESSVRRIFEVVRLGQEEDAIFPVDTDASVEVIMSAALGNPPISVFTTGLVTVNTDMYQGGWEMQEAFARSGRIDQVAHKSRRMIDSFIAKEEETGWAVINACRYAGNTVSLGSSDEGYGAASLELINAMIVKFQENGYVPNVAFMSPGCMGDFRLLCKEAGLANEVRFDVWRGGAIKGLWGIDFYTLRTLNDTYVYMFDTTRFGVMAIRQELETREDPQARSQFKIRVHGQEQVGFAALDKQAVVFGATNKS